MKDNEAGERCLDVALSYDQSVINTYIRKREKHYITYKSGSNRSQIDYHMWKREKAQSE